MNAIVVRKSFVPKLFSLFMVVNGVTLFPFIFVRDEGNDRLINHESIHIQQYFELLFIGFFIIYVWDFLIGLIKHRSFFEAYRGIRLEKEAFGNENNEFYIKERERYNWIQFKIA